MDRGIPTEAEYRFAEKRIEALLSIVNDSTPLDAPEAIELKLMSDIVWLYEEAHMPIEVPSPAELIELAIEEKGLSQREVAKNLGLSSSSMSRIVSGKALPSLDVAGRICRLLGIDPALMLGIRPEMG